jgi:SAP domain
MALWARSDLASVSVSAAHGGCGEVHVRPAPGGNPVQLWKLDCEACADYLRSDAHWSVTSSEIPETHDEKVAREDFERRGAKDKDAIMTLAIAKIAGIDPSQLPESLTRMISGQPLHIPVQGQMECPSGHAQRAGQKFCGECGAPMSAPVTKAALDAPERHAEPPVTAPLQRHGSRPVRLQDLRADELRVVARARGLDSGGVRKDLIRRLKTAGVTNGDLRQYLQPVAA